MGPRIQRSRDPRAQGSNGLNELWALLRVGNEIERTSLLGSPWLVMSSEESGLPCQAITWGTRSRAFYAAEESQPDNEFILAAIAAGLDGCQILNMRTPRVILECMRDYHNNFHAGATYSFIELLNEIPTMETSFKAVKAEKGITARMGAGGAGKTQNIGEAPTMSHEQAYWQHIDTGSHGKCSSFKMFDAAKPAYHSMCKHAIKDRFVEYCQVNVDFLNRQISNESVIFCLHKITSSLPGMFGGTLTDEHFQMPMLTPLKFCTPPSEAAVTKNDGCKWIVDKVKSLELDFLPRLMCHMEHSKTYKLQPQIEKPKEKKTKKDTAPPLVHPEKEIFVFNVPVTNLKKRRAGDDGGSSPPGTRPTTWCDDLFRMLTYAHSVTVVLGTNNKLTVDRQVLLDLKIICIALVFCFEGLGLLDGVGVDGVGGSCRIADASTMRLDV
eukprot:2612041-Pyramimonas_sp.AAC.3